MGEPAGTDRILTIPNLISLLRIALIPVFFALIVDHDTTQLGLVLFVVVVATDWVDGAIARATGQVSELGKILDPVADRLAIAAGLIALVVRDAFPLWAALLILVRDVAVLLAGLVLLSRRRVRIDVRYIGKVATFALMTAIGLHRVGEPRLRARAGGPRVRMGLLRGRHRRVLRRNRSVHRGPPACVEGPGGSFPGPRHLIAGEATWPTC